MGLDLRARWEHLRAAAQRLFESPTSELSRWGRLAVHQARLWRFCGIQLKRDRLVTVAGDLTFKTLLGLIPCLVLFLLIVGFFSRGPEVGRKVQEALYQALNITELDVVIDGEPVGLVEQIDRLVQAAGRRIGTTTTTVAGILFLFGLSMNMLATIEGAMNRIWQVRRKRPLLRRVVLFWVVLTVGPPVVAAAVYASGSVYDRAAQLPEAVAWFGRSIINLVAVWFVLFVMYKLIPNTRVEARASLTGALVAGTLWHVIAKEAFFGYYVNYAVGYGQVFGNLAVVPLFFLWIYFTWMFVLFGAELAYTVQNLKDLARAETEQADRRNGRFLAADFVAVAAAAVVARRFRDGRGPTPLGVLVDATGCSRNPLADLTGRLEEAGLLVATAKPNGEDEDAEDAWLPGRDPARVRLAEIGEAVRRFVPLPVDPDYLPLNRCLRERYEAAEAARAGEHTTLADVLEEARDADPAGAA